MLSREEKKQRREDKNVRYIAERVCSEERTNKDYVFISYKSDDWKIVLQDVTFRLVKDYGLNVYFDGDFDDNNDLWIKQFTKNMECSKCKGVLAFIDDKYATSYATLMELMFSQTERAAKKVVTVNLSVLTEIEDDTNTGLGVEDSNENAEKEKKLFDEIFKELKEKGCLGNGQYLYRPYESEELKKKHCNKITRELIKKLQVNKNEYEYGGNLTGIVNTIKNTFGKTVFSDVENSDTVEGNPLIGTSTSKEEPKEPKEVADDGKENSKENSKQKENDDSQTRPVYTFVLYGTKFEDLKLKEVMLTVFEKVMERHPDKLDQFLSNLKCLEEGDVIGKGIKSSTFRAGKVVSVGGRTISIGTSLDNEAVFRFIKRLKEICGEPESMFELCGKLCKEQDEDNCNKLQDTSDNDGEENGQQDETDEQKTSSGYTFVLYGTKFEDLYLKEVMLTVFEKVMERHLDKIDKLLSDLRCLENGSIIRKDAKPGTFRAGKVVNIDGKTISIGTSLNKENVFQMIKKLMDICEEDEDSFRIIKNAPPVKRNPKKANGKKGVGELI